MISGAPFRVVIEGANLLACGECSRLSSVKSVTKLIQSRMPPIGEPSMSALKGAFHELGMELELVNDFPKQIKRAREKLQLTHEDLGRKIGEKISVLQKIETGKMIPNQVLVKKLEHVLRIKLLSPSSEHPTFPLLQPPPSKPTLGDLVKIKKRGEVREE